MTSVNVINMGVLGGSGVCLSQPQSAGMNVSLPLLQKNYKFAATFFWGKLTGKSGDYLIAMGVEESFATKKFFFCQDGVSWAQLPAVTAEMMSDVAKIAQPGLLLSGDPAALTTLPPEPPPEDAGDDYEPPEPKTVEELQRLAVMVATIDMECAMMPAGSLIKQPSGKVEMSQTFKGLDYAKATALKSYVFINMPKTVSVNADAVTQSTDFLTSCDEMVPKGALVCKFDESLNTVCWSSLVYEGFSAYTMVGVNMSGYCYFGTGLKNADIAFMLP
jgi:hypothetical protein